VFLQKEEKRLVSGDMLLPVAPMPIAYDDPSQPGQPIRALSQLLQSFERLRAFEIQTVYPGHGKVFSDANAMIDKQLARIKMRKQMMPPDFSGMHMVLGYLDLLEEEGLIEKRLDENGVMNFRARR
jgi:glyoxylase-like metal-dependent hydrolase (beta-lactamase superfamily II)